MGHWDLAPNAHPSPHSDEVDRNLRRYFDGEAGDQFTGRWFDHFAAIGDPNRFEASDIVAVEALSVEVPSEAAGRLLITDSERFNSLLRAIPRTVDLWTAGRLQVTVGSAADDLHAALKELPKVGEVTAGKLMAAKRPRMIPIFDERVDQLLAPADELFWVSMYDELKDDEHRRVIEQVCRNTPSYVSLLRRIDVALWMAAAPKH
jgi:Family of unknown function (DUF6308)